MTILTVVQWSLTLAALFLSTFALFAWRRSSARSLSRQLSELSEQFQAMHLTQRSHAARLSQLKGQLTDKKNRVPEPTDDDLPLPASNPDEWKRKMNLRLALRGKP